MTGPAAAHTAGFDPLQDEGIAYAEKLEAAGVPVVKRHYSGLIHGHFNMGGIGVIFPAGWRNRPRYAARV